MNEKLTPQLHKSSTQAHLPIDEIREGTVLLKNGGLRGVLFVRGVNFDLKSAEEQNAIISSYQGFLNSLEFPIQILVKSKKIDLASYIANIESRSERQQNNFLKNVMLDYVEFIRSLTSVANVMTKEFYVIVPYSPLTIPKKGAFASLLGGGGTAKEKDFLTHKKVLDERVQTTLNGLESASLRAARLSTQELIELFYTSYNAESSVHQKFTGSNEITTGVVSAPSLNTKTTIDPPTL